MPPTHSVQSLVDLFLATGGTKLLGPKTLNKVIRMDMTVETYDSNKEPMKLRLSVLWNVPEKLIRVSVIPGSVSLMVTIAESDGDNTTSIDIHAIQNVVDSFDDVALASTVSEVMGTQVSVQSEPTDVRQDFIVSGSWTNRTGWLEGEPCTDQWWGVQCCPVDMPHLRDLFIDGELQKHCATHETGTRGDSVNLRNFSGRAHEEWQPLGAGGCRNPSVTGTSTDSDQCVVVGVDLKSNNLTNNLGEYLGALPFLKELDVSGNDLKGSLPNFLSERSWDNLNIGGNAFYFNNIADSEMTDVCTPCRASTNAISPTARALIEHCVNGDLPRGACEGLPPYGCEAFSPSQCEECFFVVEATNPTQCIRCDANPYGPIAFMIALPVIIMLGIGVYAWMMLKNPRLLRGSISTFTILFSHAQTINIFAQLQLPWPRSVDILLEYLGINLFSFEIGRPECLIGEDVNSDLGGVYYMLNTGRLLAVAVAFILIFLVGTCERFRLSVQLKRAKKAAQDEIHNRWKKAKQSGQRQTTRTVDRHRMRIERQVMKSTVRSDRLELVETIVFGMQLMASWKITLQFFSMPGQGGLFGQLGFALAIVLVIYQAFIISKYLIYLEVLKMKLFGLRWVQIDAPHAKGEEVYSSDLADAILDGRLDFDANEFEHFRMGILTKHHFIEVDGKYYQPTTRPRNYQRKEVVEEHQRRLSMSIDSRDMDVSDQSHSENFRQTELRHTIEPSNPKLLAMLGRVHEDHHEDHGHGHDDELERSVTKRGGTSFANAVFSGLTHRPERTTTRRSAHGVRTTHRPARHIPADELHDHFDDDHEDDRWLASSDAPPLRKEATRKKVRLSDGVPAGDSKLARMGVVASPPASPPADGEPAPSHRATHLPPPANDVNVDAADHGLGEIDVDEMPLDELIAAGQRGSEQHDSELHSELRDSLYGGLGDFEEIRSGVHSWKPARGGTRQRHVAAAAAVAATAPVIAGAIVEEQEEDDEQVYMPLTVGSAVRDGVLVADGEDTEADAATLDEATLAAIDVAYEADERSNATRRWSLVRHEARDETEVFLPLSVGGIAKGSVNEESKDVAEEIFSAKTTPDVSSLALSRWQLVREDVKEISPKDVYAAKRQSFGVPDPELPDEFLCPITRERMKDPVVVSDGHSYERKAILEVMRSANSVSPLTREPLDPDIIVKNRTLKKNMDEYEEEKLQEALHALKTEREVAQQLEDATKGMSDDEVLATLAQDNAVTGERRLTCCESSFESLSERQHNFWETLMAHPSMDVRRLQGRLTYMTERYGDHAPWWEFMIWMREAMLLLLVFVPEISLQGVYSEWEAPNNTDVTNATNMRVEYEALATREAGKYQAAFAIGMFSFFWFCHLRVQPYPQLYQNRIESLLYATDIGLMIFGLLLSTVFTTLPLWVEIVMVLLVIGVNLGIFTYLIFCGVRRLIRYCRSAAIRRHAADLARDTGTDLKMAAERLSSSGPVGQLARMSTSKLGDHLLRQSVALETAADLKLESEPAPVEEKDDWLVLSQLPAPTGGRQGERKKSAFYIEPLEDEGQLKDAPGMMTRRGKDKDASIQKRRLGSGGGLTERSMPRSQIGNALAEKKMSLRAGMQEDSRATSAQMTQRNELTQRKMTLRAGVQMAMASKKLAQGGDKTELDLGTAISQLLDEQLLKTLPLISWDQIHLEILLGDGGRGDVHHAHKAKRPSVMRRVHASSPLALHTLEELHRETAALAELKHPNLLRILGMSQDADLSTSNTAAGAVLVEEQCACSLDEAVRNKSIVPGQWSAFTMRILHQVAGALMFLHGQGASHGRLHPRNVLLKVVGGHALSSARVKLSDYQGKGCADAADLNSEIRYPGQPPNTTVDTRWAYLAPEVAARKRLTAIAPATSSEALDAAPPRANQSEGYSTLLTARAQLAKARSALPASSSASINEPLPEDVTDGQIDGSTDGKATRAPSPPPSPPPALALGKGPNAKGGSIGAGRRGSLLGRRLSAIGGLGLRLGKSSQPTVPSAVSADMWAYGCLINFIGTGEAPYATEVHERAAEAYAADDTISGLYEVLETAASKQQSPLAPLREASADCPSDILTIATRCVHPDVTMRAHAVQVLSRLPRETGLFAAEAEGHARREQTRAKVQEKMLAHNPSRKTVNDRKTGHHGHHEVVRAPNMVLPMASALPAPGQSLSEAEHKQHIAERERESSGNRYSAKPMPMASRLPAPSFKLDDPARTSKDKRETMRVRV